MMGFGEAVGTCFRKYFTFSGRARRPEYWWFVLFFFIVLFVASAVDAILFEEAPILYGLAFLVLFIPTYAVTWRRLHDVGRAGYWALAPLLMIVLAFAAVIAAFALGYVDMEEIMAVGEGSAEASPPMIAVFAIVAVSYLAAIVIGLIVFIWTLFGSQSGENRYGPEPGAAVKVQGVFD